ncbi:hypothetical protein V1477_004999, partial [Vespula maculifrons]
IYVYNFSLAYDQKGGSREIGLSAVSKEGNNAGSSLVVNGGGEADGGGSKRIALIEFRLYEELNEGETRLGGWSRRVAAMLTPACHPAKAGVASRASRFTRGWERFLAKYVSQKRQSSARYRAKLTERFRKGRAKFLETAPLIIGNQYNGALKDSVAFETRCKRSRGIPHGIAVKMFIPVAMAGSRVVRTVSVLVLYIVSVLVMRLKGRFIGEFVSVFKAISKRSYLLLQYAQVAKSEASFLGETLSSETEQTQ